MNCVKSRGYVLAVCEDADDPYICGALHVERDDSTWDYETDEEAVRAAGRDGVKLLYGIPYVEDGVYLDIAGAGGYNVGYQIKGGATK